jgi:hypothetical protein
VAEISESALDAVLASGEILFRERQHEFPQFRGDRRTSGLVLPSRGVIPFLGDQLPMPTQNGVGRAGATLTRRAGPRGLNRSASSRFAIADLPRFW